MTINKKLDGTKLTVALEGRLDTTTSPQLEAELNESITSVAELEFDFGALEYISSAGLRVMLSAKKTMDKQSGNMVIKNANEQIMEVFEITGFNDILNIE